MLDLTKLDLSEKQRQLLSTALDLFLKFGIKRIAVEEICKKADVSKMTFYKYFENKNALVRFLWRNAFEQALAKFDEIRALDVAFEKKLQLILKMKEEGSAKISHEFALDYFYASPDLRGFFEKYVQKSISCFLDFIKEAQDKGEVRADLRPEFLLAVINNINHMVKDTAMVGAYPSYQDFVMEVNNFLFYGILPRPVSKEK